MQGSAEALEGFVRDDGVDGREAARRLERSPRRAGETSCSTRHKDDQELVPDYPAELLRTSPGSQDEMQVDLQGQVLHSTMQHDIMVQVTAMMRDLLANHGKSAGLAMQALASAQQDLAMRPERVERRGMSAETSVGVETDLKQGWPAEVSPAHARQDLANASCPNRAEVASLACSSERTMNHDARHESAKAAARELKGVVKINGIPHWIPHATPKGLQLTKVEGQSAESPKSVFNPRASSPFTPTRRQALPTTGVGPCESPKDRTETSDTGFLALRGTPS